MRREGSARPTPTDRHRSRIRRGVLCGVLLSLLLPATTLAAIGALTQKAGTAGCISEDGTAGACVDGRALVGAISVTVSPDGISAYGASETSDAVTIFNRNTTTGVLTQKALSAGCISETGTRMSCVNGKALNVARSVTVSPDGKNAYVASAGSSAVAIFDRSTATGALTQKAGTAGCISEDGTAGACVDGLALVGASSVTIAPDGASAYVASPTSGAVAIFDRNTTTGVLTQKVGTAGCISDTGIGPCVDVTALDRAASVAVAPDGTSAYVASETSDAVAIFDRNTTTGALTQKAGTAGCISNDGSGGACVDGIALDGALAVAVSPDAASVYVASKDSDAVAIFDRNTTTGALTQKAGTAGCISDTAAGPCADGSALSGASSVAVAPDGASAYVASNSADAVAIFDRNTTTGALTQKPATAGCVSNSGTAGACVDGTAIDGPGSVTVSPDGANAYVASEFSGAIAIFDRDLTTPQTTIDSGPSGPTKDTTPAFAFSSSVAGSTFECKVDDTAFAACSGPGATHTTIGLADGTHTFTVRALDPAATPDPTPATRTFTVDTVSPVVEITKQPRRRLRTAKRRIRVKTEFRSDLGSSFRCKLDRESMRPCTSPFTASVVSKRGKGKRHTITITATDLAGNVSERARVAFRAIRTD